MSMLIDDPTVPIPAISSTIEITVEIPKVHVGLIPVTIPLIELRAKLCYSCMRPIQFCVCKGV